jgi:hypothetical protein
MAAWAITQDYQAEIGARPGTNANAVGLVGPRTAKLTFDEIVKHPDGKRFQMRDDDGELYYEGVLVGGDGFEPLDDFGEPNAGCTSICVLENGHWEQV